MRGRDKVDDGTSDVLEEGVVGVLARDDEEGGKSPRWWCCLPSLLGFVDVEEVAVSVDDDEAVADDAERKVMVVVV